MKPLTIQPLTGYWATRCDVCGKEYDRGCGSSECCGSIQTIIKGSQVSESALIDWMNLHPFELLKLIPENAWYGFNEKGDRVVQWMDLRTFIGREMRKGAL